VRAKMADTDPWAALNAAIYEWNGNRTWTRPLD
jgi:hypothetical protein